MSLYIYRKAPVQYLPQTPTPTFSPVSPTPSASPLPPSTTPTNKAPSPKLNSVRRLIPTVLITLGSLMIANVAWPIIHYQLFVSPRLSQAQLITPININQTAFITPASPPQTKATSPPTDQVLSQEIDYTKITNWFPSAVYTPNNSPQITHYYLSIPKLNITDAVVQIGGEDLSQHLIQYPGTANPGQLGSPVIFGHSVLRQFYNPSQDNPRRYISIFSKIMTLQNGDEIFIDYDGIRYKYKVKDKLEIKPEDVYILQQRYNNRQLKLITCVPEGTYLRRGVVVAQLADYQ